MARRSRNYMLCLEQQKGSCEKEHVVRADLCFACCVFLRSNLAVASAPAEF